MDHRALYGKVMLLMVGQDSFKGLECRSAVMKVGQALPLSTGFKSRANIQPLYKSLQSRR